MNAYLYEGPRGCGFLENKGQKKGMGCCGEKAVAMMSGIPLCIEHLKYAFHNMRVTPRRSFKDLSYMTDNEFLSICEGKAAQS
jgi:hypothetical protein